MGWFRREGGWRGSGLLLLALALAVRVATPTGWMFAPGDGHGAPRLVICTGHGPAPFAAGKSGQPAKAPEKSSDHPCVFAGPGAPTPPALIAATTRAPAVPSRVLAPARLADQRPGRGLAAPPPPSQGPPTARI